MRVPVNIDKGITMPIIVSIMFVWFALVGVGALVCLLGGAWTR